MVGVVVVVVGEIVVLVCSSTSSRCVFVVLVLVCSSTSGRCSSSSSSR